MVGAGEIDRRMGYHPATRQTIPMYEENRAQAVNLAVLWDTTLPPGRELALALTALQEALMWANAAVACNLAPLEDPAGREPNPLVQQMAARDRSAAEQSGERSHVHVQAVRCWCGVEHWRQDVAATEAAIIARPAGPEFIDPAPGASHTTQA